MESTVDPNGHKSAPYISLFLQPEKCCNLGLHLRDVTGGRWLSETTQAETGGDFGRRDDGFSRERIFVDEDFLRRR